MKFDYNIKWLNLAHQHLLNQANYILIQSQDKIIALNFFNSVQQEVGKDTVYITDFKSCFQQ